MSNKKKKLVIGVQCRISSSRLPGKSLLKLDETTVLGMCLKRAILSGYPVYLLTSDEKSDDIIVNEARNCRVNGIIRGSLTNVLSRFISLSNKTDADYIIRVTADNPLTEFRFIDELSNFVISKEYFYATMNNNICPEGTNLEIFSSKALKDSFDIDQSQENLEHVTYHMKKISSVEQFLAHNYLGYKKNEYTKMSFTIDNLEDYVKVSKLIKKVKEEYDCDWSNNNFVSLITKYIKFKGNEFYSHRNHYQKY